MNISIGERYEATKADLAERVKKGLLERQEILTVGLSCYFCMERFSGSAYVLIDRKEKSTAYYVVDCNCHHKILNFHYAGGQWVATN